MPASSIHPSPSVSSLVGIISSSMVGTTSLQGRTKPWPVAADEEEDRWLEFSDRSQRDINAGDDITIEAPSSLTLDTSDLGERQRGRTHRTRVEMFGSVGVRV